MRARIPVAIALVVGVVVGSSGVWALCNRGHCGDRSPAAAQASATRTASVFSAGQSWGDSTSAVASVVPTDMTAPPRSPALTFPASGTPSGGTWITGLAIIGDSTADEYRADNPRGGEFGDTTFNWVELLARERAVNLGAWGERPEPRRGGYEYNWARSGATTESMISSGQHTGVEEQIAAGQVSHVIIQIGINDFYYDNTAFGIYDGRLTHETLQQFLDGMVANVEKAVQAAKSARGCQVILAATQDYLAAGLLPGTLEIFPDDAGRQRLIDAFAYLNEGLRAVAARERVPFFDFNAALQSELENRFDPANNQFILVGGERIDVSAKGNEPHHVFVDDDYAHPGTVFSGLIANLYIEQMNAVFDTRIEPFSDDDILRVAGLR